MMYTPH